MVPQVPLVVILGFLHVRLQIPSNLALSNSLPPGFSFDPGTAPSASSVLGPYLPHTCDGYQYQSRNQEDLSMEVRLTSSQTQSQRWVVGAYYAEVKEVVVGYGADLGKGFELKAYVPPDGKNPTDFFSMICLILK